MDGIKIIADQGLSKIKSSLNSEILGKFGDNTKYVFMPLKIDHTLLKELENQPTIDIIFDLFEKISGFKNLNFFKKGQISEKLEADGMNQDILNYLNTSVSYLETKGINTSSIKGYFGGFSDVKKINLILENEYITNNVDKKLLKKFEKSLQDINSNIGSLELRERIDELGTLKNEMREKITGVKGLFVNDGITVIPTERFYNDIFDKNIELIDVYRIFSFLGVGELEGKRQGKTFFYKPGFINNNNYKIVIDILNSDFNNVKVFDGMILGFSNLTNTDILTKLSELSGGYRNNALYIPEGSTEKINKLIGKINPALDLIYMFKGLKYKELGSNKNDNRIFNLDKDFAEKQFSEKVLPYIKDLTKYQGNNNFYNINYIHDNKEFQDKIMKKLETKGKITLNEFLYFCNYGLDKTTEPKNHKINFLSGNFIELVKDIKKYKKIIIADFESTCLNDFRDGDILSMSYKAYDNTGKEIKSKSYYVEKYKKEVTEGAMGAFDYEDYLKQDKINREKLVKGLKSLIDKDTLFVFHNGYNFDVEIMKSNFTDIGETVEGMNVLDTTHLAKEYYKSIRDPNYDIYSYSLDKLSSYLGVKNNRDKENHRSEEDVEILSDLFFKMIKIDKTDNYGDLF